MFVYTCKKECISYGTLWFLQSTSFSFSFLFGSYSDFRVAFLFRCPWKVIPSFQVFHLLAHCVLIVFVFSPSPGCSCITSTLLACGVYGLFIVWHIVRQGNNSINKNGKRREGNWETQGDALIWCNVCDQTTEEADSVKKGEAHRKKLSCAFCDKLFWLENIIKYSTHKCAYANAMELAGSLAFLLACKHRTQVINTFKAVS